VRGQGGSVQGDSSREAVQGKMSYSLPTSADAFRCTRHALRFTNLSTDYTVCELHTADSVKMYVPPRRPRASSYVHFTSYILLQQVDASEN